MLNKIRKITQALKKHGLIKLFKLAIAHSQRLYKFRYGYYISKSAIIESRKSLFIDKRAEIQDYVIIRGTRSKVKIGKYSSVNPFTVMYSGSGIIIGKDVIASGNHDFIQNKVSMRHASYLSTGPIIIEDGVWIGANSTITDGVKIGREAVVGAGSVVVKDVEPWSIVGGVPAEVIGYRKKNVDAK